MMCAAAPHRTESRCTPRGPALDRARERARAGADLPPRPFAAEHSDSTSTGAHP
jgi:hypothetical protein